MTDIVDSTGAIAQGRHKTVNFVAAMAIAALRNLCAPTRIPFLFGGDGAVVMVPPEYAAQARLVLARVRGMATRDFELTLRAGLVPVRELRHRGSAVLVGRFEPTPGNSFGVFLGGGVGLLEAAIRGRGNAELAALAAVPDALDDGAPVDLEGLSCRWDTLQSARGAMLTLILHGAGDLSEVYTRVVALAGPDWRRGRFARTRSRRAGRRGLHARGACPAPRRRAAPVGRSRPVRFAAGPNPPRARQADRQVRPAALSQRNRHQHRLLQARRDGLPGHRIARPPRSTPSGAISTQRRRHAASATASTSRRRPS